MSTLRTQTIEALDKLIRAAAAFTCQAVKLNDTIRESKLPIPLIDPLPAFQIQRAAEMMLREMEMKAGFGAALKLTRRAVAGQGREPVPHSLAERMAHIRESSPLK